MRFAHPHFLYLLSILPVLAGLFWVREHNFKRVITQFFGVRLGSAFNSISVAQRRWRWIFGLGCLGFMFVALARPQNLKGKTEVVSEGIELILAVDVSKSMDAEEGPLSRLATMREGLIQLVRLLEGSRIGIVAFAGSAFLLSPMTHDRNAIVMYLESLTSSTVSNQGTDLARALKASQEALDRGGVPIDAHHSVAQAVLIASDGEDSSGEAVHQASQLRDKGIRVYALAFGSEQGAPIPIRDDEGRIRGYKSDKSGKMVVTKLEATTLQDIVRAGNGLFFQALHLGENINDLAADLLKLEKTRHLEATVAEYEELFWIPLFLALICGLMEILLFDRARRQRIRPVRSALASRPLKYIMVGLSGAGHLGAMSDSRADPSTHIKNLKSEVAIVRLNNRAVKKLKAKDPYEAEKNILRALSQLPEQAETHFNLAQVFQAYEDYDRALTEYQVVASSSSDAELKFKSLFNSAIVAAQLKKIDLALELYQKALELRPDSIEVKANIEWMLKNDKQQGSQGGDGEAESDQGKSAGDKTQPDSSDNSLRVNRTHQKSRRFESEQLTEKDVHKILEELKNQEQDVRARINKQPTSDSSNDRDW